MTREEAKIIIKEEKLCFYNWFEDHGIRENEIGIYQKNSQWIVYTSSERASKEAVFTYSVEDEALEDFIERLRGDKEYRELFEAK